MIPLSSSPFTSTIMICSLTCPPKSVVAAQVSLVGEGIVATLSLVSVPDPNQTQCGSLPVVLEAICTGVGLGLGPRLLSVIFYRVLVIPLLQGYKIPMAG